MTLALLRSMIETYDPSRVSTVMSSSESMPGDNYIWVGESAVEVIMASVMASHLTEVQSVLDLPSGHGRVLRHMVQLFPAAVFDVCDLDKDGTDFCASEFGANVVPPVLDLTKAKFPRQYDLIWIGSLFTHLPKAKTLAWLDFLSRQLTPKGIIVATFHGRWSQRMQDLIPYTDAGRWSIVKKGFDGPGYGFVDYAPGLGHDFVPGSYGVSAVRPDHLMAMVQKIDGVRIFHFQEKAWGENHDVLAFGRPDWSELPESWPKD